MFTVLPNINCTQAARRAEKAVFVPVTLTFDLKLVLTSNEGAKHVFHVNLVHICSAVPEIIFHTNIRSTQQ